MIEGEMTLVRDQIQLDTKASSRCNGKFSTNLEKPTIPPFTSYDTKGANVRSAARLCISAL